MKREALAAIVAASAKLFDSTDKDVIQTATDLAKWIRQGENIDPKDLAWAAHTIETFMRKVGAVAAASSAERKMEKFIVELLEQLDAASTHYAKITVKLKLDE